MKTLRILICLAFVVTIVSCKKDATSEPSGILKNYLTTIPSTYTPYYYPGNAVELGYKFKPLVDGNITSLGLRMVSAGEYTVNIYTGSWSSSATRIAYAKIQQPISQMWNYVQIPALKITTDKTYYITVSIPTNSKYERTQDVTFPINTSNISILSHVGISYLTSTPNYSDNDNGLNGPAPYFESFPDFVFSN